MSNEDAMSIKRHLANHHIEAYLNGSLKWLTKGHCELPFTTHLCCYSVLKRHILKLFIYSNLTDIEKAEVDTLVYKDYHPHGFSLVTHANEEGLWVTLYCCINSFVTKWSCKHRVSVLFWFASNSLSRRHQNAFCSMAGFPSFLPSFSWCTRR